jgi:hypothetical protein
MKSSWKSKLISMLLAIVGFIASTMMVFATPAPPETMINGHPDFGYWLFGFAFIGYAYFQNRQITQNDKHHQDLHDTNEKQWKSIAKGREELEDWVRELAQMKGEHNIMMSQCGHKRANDPPHIERTSSD